MPKNKKPELKPGEKYNRLTIIKFHHSDKRWRKWYNVKCDCGNEKIVMGSAMVSNNTKSCGCLSMETKKRKRISNNHSEITAIILCYKRHAERRGFKWLLSRHDVKSIIKKDCYYCGSEPSNVKKTKNSISDGLKYSGIDRIDSMKDYTIENTVPCCRICNYAKSNMTLNEFKQWAIRLGKKAIAEQWAGNGW
jgi:ribosomal protein S27E